MNIKHRLSIGILLSPQLRKRLRQEMEKWPKEALIFTSEENLHVSLFSLGFVQEEEIGEICQKIQKACEDTEAFEINFTDIMLTENETNPKTIILQGESNDELRILLEKIEKTFSSFVAERKQYRPHVTLAKMKKTKWLALENKPVLKTAFLLNETVEEISLFESLSVDGKYRYETLNTFPLL